MIDRRTFTQAWVAALLGGATITITEGCGDGPTGPYGGNPTPQPTPTQGGDEVGVISGNHGHSAVITSAELTAGAALVLNIEGSAGHNHQVALSADEVMAIRDGQTVTKPSSETQSHQHNVTFN